MKTTVTKNSLKEGLAVVERLSVKSTSLPILGNILLTAEKNLLELSATDLEIGIRYALLASAEEKGGAVIPSRLLSQFVGLLPEDKVVLNSTAEGLQLQAGEHRATVRALDPEDFPIIPRAEQDALRFRVPAQGFCEGIGRVVGVVGHIQSRPEISGVYFAAEKKQLKAVATDSFRLAEATMTLSEAVPSEQSFILPAKTARELVSIFGDKEGAVLVSLSSSQVVFEYDPKEDPADPRIELVSRLIEGEYPKYQNIIPTQHTTQFQVKRAALLNHLKAASIFAGKLQDVRLSVDPQKGIVKMQARDADVGEHASSLEVEATGEPVEASFNWRFFMEGAAQVKDEIIEVALGGEDAPALLRGGQKSGYLYVVMPIRA